MPKTKMIPDEVVSKEGDIVVTMPYIRTTEKNGDLLVGLTLKDMPTMGEEPVLCAIGGFIKKDDKSILRSQIRTSIEETGMYPGKKAKKVIGVNNVFNSFFIADLDLDTKIHIHIYGLEIPLSWLEKEENDNNGKKLISNLSIPVWPIADNLRFLPWREAICITPDAIARSAIAQLLATVL